MIILKCDNCGKEIKKRYPRKNNFCDRKCYGRFKNTIKDEKDFQNIISEYIKGVSTIKLGKLYNVSDMSINKILKKNNIPLRDKNDYVRVKGVPRTEEVKEKIRKTTKEKMANPEIREYLRNKTLQQLKNNKHPKSNTSIEKKMTEFLIELGLKFEFQKIFGYWVYDFFLPDYNIFIECDGDYWHGNPKFYSKFNETQRNNIGRGKQKEKYILNRGFRLLRFWENDIKKDPASVKKSIEEIINESNKIE